MSRKVDLNLLNSNFKNMVIVEDEISESISSANVYNLDYDLSDSLLILDYSVDDEDCHSYHVEIDLVDGSRIKRIHGLKGQRLNWESETSSSRSNIRAGSYDYGILEEVLDSFTADDEEN